MENYKITVESIMQREIFMDAELVAGSEGIDREIKWTHILEMESFDSFINGGELILTTGSNIDFGSPHGMSKIRTLIESGVTGICIELGHHVTKVDSSILKLADDHAFPIIIFNKTVKFVDITQDLHTLIINSHHTQLEHLHLLSKEFNELSLEPNGIIKILKNLHNYFHKTVILITDEKKLYYYPLKVKKHAEYINSLIDDSWEIQPYISVNLDKTDYSVFPIKGLGHSWGNLYFQEEAEDIDEFSYSILDRATLAIAQILLRNQTIEERKQNQEGDIVKKLVHEKSFEPSLAQKFLPYPSENLYYRVMIIEKSNIGDEISPEDWEEIKLTQAIILRNLFKSFGFRAMISVTINTITVISSFYKNQQTIVKDQNFNLVTDAIQNTHEKNIFNGEECHISASSLNKDYSKLHECYKEANEVLHLKKLDVLKDVLFYEELGAYRLLTKLDKNELESLVSTYLSPLLDFERKTNNNNLLLTLTIYLETMGSKKETSERLYIVRQTLYYRLEKIKELLGENFMNPVSRQAIELAISANKLLDEKRSKQ
ncbi:PucR family transcriptional regulator [Lacicoccus alkaliphilus]|uniref:Purine catabolism regulatory protein n=1 Tax=Lacicoccus alkaliphilus DSM 16010 TaxID=1123231 RepID=A0A1M7JIM0_9BACL|nr:PucR family transcriptional regulator ligand-binding domain-containing protein [Salinicoccus alkaliphilus]SHM52796.1 purine catabolism regulatory protein [Salinicoccus alkaliphilus DSM 16010]